MKKLISLSLLLVMLLSFASCGSDGSDSNGISKADCVGTWVSDEYTEYNEMLEEDEYMAHTFEFYESGTGTSEVVATKTSGELEAGETVVGGSISWELKDGYIIVDDSSLKFDESDSTHSTLIRLDTDNRVYHKK